MDLLGVLFRLQLQEPSLHLLAEKLGLLALVARALESWAIGVVLDQCPDEEHGGLARGARTVLQAPCRHGQHPSPLLARENSTSSLPLRGEVRQGLQGLHAHPGGLVYGACRQGKEQVLLRGRLDGESDHGLLPCSASLAILAISLSFLAGIAIGIAVASILSLLGALGDDTAAGTPGQVPAFSREELSDALHDCAPQRVAIDIEKGEEDGDVGEDYVRQPLGHCH
mmetsp:Transcript_35512/g.77734  ORF Transcript_35512/g.77734 Transcript_35512/m.77734 type:complete len:226 (-) Transcript_35512:1059-1736(-)